MKKRGLVIIVVGTIMVGISLTVAASIVPAEITTTGFSMSSILDDMFNDVSNETLILPNDSAYFSYSTLSSNVPLLWGIQIIDYKAGDKISTKISNIYGDDYGVIIQDEPILFEVLEITQSDTLNFEVQNIGTASIVIVIMFSEDPENSDAVSNPNSPVNSLLVPLAISGFMLILGIIISIIGLIVFLLDWKNIQDSKRNY